MTICGMSSPWALTRNADGAISAWSNSVDLRSCEYCRQLLVWQRDSEGKLPSDSKSDILASTRSLSGAGGLD